MKIKPDQIQGIGQGKNMVTHEPMTWAFIDTTKNSKVMKKLVHSLLHAVTAISKKSAAIVFFFWLLSWMML